MFAYLLKLLALIAVAFMPLGMGAAPAAAATHHAAPSAESHCGGEEEPKQAPGKTMMGADCMACSGVPAATPASPAEAMLLRAPLSLSLVEEFRGIEPEIATPPPKRA